ncbi:Mu transposase C-terminal domain-containing protein [Cellvibrio sp. UBA7671]|uniref:Mu transposase C-terminal domain-containing protein n=1 Tax=Cellvibrio sp. UBA7671 TaxID=1946312 RepID=UPI002F35A76A
MTNKYNYQVGHVFDFYGSSYQIADISYGSIRYSAIKGGKVFRVSISQFDQISAHEKFSWDSTNLPARLNIEAVKNRCRRQSYVSAAIKEMLNPRNERHLKKLIPIIASELNDNNPPSAKTVGRWVRRFQQDSRGLEDKRPSGNMTLRYDPLIEQLILEAINKIYLKKERRSAKDVEAYLIGRLIETGLMITDQESITIPTIRTIQRRISELDPYVVMQARQGKYAAQRYVRSAGRTLRSYTALTLVQIDTHVLDIIVIDELTGEPVGRPYLVCIIDIATRMVVGYYVSLFPPSATTTLAALAYMLIHYGIPAQIVPDNGVELKNTSFSRVCSSLYISIVRAQVQDPNGKAHIESFFRTLTYALTQKIPGTTFSNPAQRGSYDSKDNACFTLEEIRLLIHEWIHNIYHKSIHRTTGRAPEIAWKDEIKIIVPNKLSEAEVQVLLRQPHKRTIHNGTVVFEHLIYTSHALSVFEGEVVTIMVDELDLSFVYVNHPEKADANIKADSVDPEYTRGLTIYEHRESLKIKSELSKKDINAIGKYTLQYARYLLLERINEGTKIARKWLRSVMNKAIQPPNVEQAVQQKYPAHNPDDSTDSRLIQATTTNNQDEFTSITLSMDN